MKEEEVTIGDRYSGTGNCGESDGKHINGILLEIVAHHDHALLKCDKGMHHSVWSSTLKPIISDSEILKIYHQGWNDELDGDFKNEFKEPLLIRAYNNGRIDSIVGDDISSVDFQSNEEIIKSIKDIVEK